MSPNTEKFLTRTFEIFPGALTWFVLIFPIVISFWYPETAALFILFYTVLWLFRSIKFSAYLIRAYLTAREYSSYDWQRAIHYFDNDELLEQDIRNSQDKPKFLKLLNFVKKRKQELRELGELKTGENLKHVVVIATYKEPLDILRPTIQSIQKSRYDLKDIIVVLATEERDRENALHNAQVLEEEFKDVFGGFYHFMHPKDIPGEVPGKGGNICFSGQKIAEVLGAQGVDFSDVILTTLDADNRIHIDYFGNLSFFYLLTKNRKQRSYQPLPLFYNNIWNVPVFNRLTAISSSFWHIIESGRPDRLRNFSSHAQSLDALIDMDFWSRTSIVEDGHQYWRAYFCYDGDHHCIPTFIPIYQDAVENESYYKSVVGQYKQLRRWAWGCSDIAFVIINMIKKGNKISIWRNVGQLFRLIEGHFMWATAPVIITMAPFVPYLINNNFNQTVVAHNIPIVLSYIFSIALIGIFISMWISVIMLPPPPKNFWFRVGLIFQWIAFPITTIILGSVPAIDSQTRLMIGKRLDFNVTEKIRKKPPPVDIKLQQKQSLA